MMETITNKQGHTASEVLAELLSGFPHCAVIRPDIGEIFAVTVGKFYFVNATSVRTDRFEPDENGKLIMTGSETKQYTLQSLDHDITDVYARWLIKGLHGSPLSVRDDDWGEPRAKGVPR